MNISYNWLKNYIDCDLTPEEMAKILTDIGLEIESFEKIEAVKGGLEGVVVGEVLTCENHPDSDHLHVTTVSVGTEEPLQIVCGAPNCRQGLKVMVATINTVLHPIDSDEEFKIKKSKIRGVESFGMLCAEDELGIGRDHAGIMELSAEAVPGTKAMDYLNLKDDYQLGIGLTPNRIDAASHYGVARDLCAYLKANGKRVSLSLPSVEEFKIDNNHHAINVKVENNEAAPRYAGITISNVKIAPSPEWLQTSLRAIGINPKNNVVDITNFILHELCQPLHAFDADKIAGERIIVRTCEEGTPFKTLDGVERKLSANDLMICDAEKPMCIAGVFGGEDSGVTENTTNVFIESAYFNPVWVRKTAKRHGLNTDASFRFERGIDPNITIYALKRAAMLIKEYAGGEITSDIIDIYPSKAKPFDIEISYDYINTLIGKEIPSDKVKSILKSLEIEIKGEKDGILYIAVPPYRVDVQRAADIVEEILRIYGYNNIEIPEHVNSTLSYEPKPNKDKITNITANMLTNMGFTEIMSNSLSKSSYYETTDTYKAEDCVKIINPLSNDLSVMRQTLLFNMMEAVAVNINHKNSDLKLYEFGNVYTYDQSKKEEGGLAPYGETNKLAIAITGQDAQATWNTRPQATNFFTLKGVLERVMKRLGINFDNLVCDTLSNDIFSDALSLKSNGKEIIQFGVIGPKIKRMFDIKSDVYFAEINFDAVIKATKKNRIAAKELPKFPEVKRDLALLIDTNVTFSELRKIAMSTEKKFLKKVSLFDVYQGDKLPEGKKSYALSFILQDESKTMDDKNIDRIMNNLITQFQQKAGAVIR